MNIVAEPTVGAKFRRSVGLFTQKEAYTMLGMTLGQWLYAKAQGYVAEPANRLNGSRRTYYTKAEIEHVRALIAACRESVSCFEQKELSFF